MLALPRPGVPPKALLVVEVPVKPPKEAELLFKLLPNMPDDICWLELPRPWKPVDATGKEMDELEEVKLPVFRTEVPKILDPVCTAELPKALPPVTPLKDTDVDWFSPFEKDPPKTPDVGGTAEDPKGLTLVENAVKAFKLVEDWLLPTAENMPEDATDVVTAGLLKRGASKLLLKESKPDDVACSPVGFPNMG